MVFYFFESVHWDDQKLYYQNRKSLELVFSLFDFEVSAFFRNTKIWVPCEQNTISSSNKKKSFLTAIIWQKKFSRGGNL